MAGRGSGFGSSKTVPAVPVPPVPLVTVSGLQKGPVERGHVNKRQKSSKSVKKFFDTSRQVSRRAKSVKNRQKMSKSFSTLVDKFFARHPFSGPFWGAPMWVLKKTVPAVLVAGSGLVPWPCCLRPHRAVSSQNWGAM